MKKLHYVVNARMPSNKAYGIQVAKMCEAFIELGIELELIIPKTRQSNISLREFYNLRVNVPTRVCAGPDWYGGGSVGFAITSIVFMASVCLYLLRHRSSALVYTIDMGSYSYAPLALLNIPIAVEMHSPKSLNILTRFFFKRVKHIITTNPLIKDELASVFNIKDECFIVEPNGVDQSAFAVSTKDEARKELKLPAQAKIVLYVGRFYDWKEIAMLQKAAHDLASTGVLVYLVGGTHTEFEEATKVSSAPLRFGGFVAHNDIAVWCSAADLLLILGTRANEFSYRYTAPMKLFEYLASGQPVVAADTLALRSLVSDQEVTFYTPNDSADLVRKIIAVFSDPEKSNRISMNGLQKARRQTWFLRAERIHAFITK
jgi:glycosyltransferase involved in cell wall biosynthesis